MSFKNIEDEHEDEDESKVDLNQYPITLI